VQILNCHCSESQLTSKYACHQLGHRVWSSCHFSRNYIIRAGKVLVSLCCHVLAGTVGQPGSATKAEQMLLSHSIANQLTPALL
jgi:hypothetical protein